MISWVSIFSQFTPEALLFEALIIFLLCCLYTAFWVLRKRRYGSVKTAIPSGPVKSYLNELILNSEQLRLQLFGLLSASDPSSAQHYRIVAPSSPVPTTVAAIPGDPTQKSAILEAKVLEQVKVIESLANEKAQLEKDLTETKAKLSSGSGDLSLTAKEDSDGMARLQQKIQDLESKLAEYNVIEDDLANLKRLQQENTVLKAALAEKGIPLPGPGASAPATWEAHSAPAASGGPPASPAPEMVTTSSEPPPEVPSEPSEPNPSTAPSSSAAESTPSSPAASPSDASATPLPTKSENEKSEADLVAEFERMLKG